MRTNDFTVMFLALVLFGLSSSPASAQQASGNQPICVARVEIHGHRRVPDETFRYYLKTQEGQAFDPKVIEGDVRVLYSLGVFQNVRVRKVVSDSGVDVSFEVVERPLIKNIQHEGLDQPQLTKLNQKLQEKNSLLRRGSRYDPAEVWRVERLIEEFLDEEGHAFAAVESEVEEHPGLSVTITFKITLNPGPPVGEIVFEGNSSFADGRLRDEMKTVRERTFFTAVTRRDVYGKLRLAADLERLAAFYQQHGYARVVVGEPRIEVIEQNSSRLFPLPLGEREVKRVKVTIPIIEGSQYRLDEVELLTGGSPLLAAATDVLTQFKKGAVYDARKLQLGFEQIKKLYGAAGFLDMNPAILQDFDEAAKSVTVKFQLEDAHSFQVARIEFVGNRRVPDKLLRRELLIKEGENYNEGLLDRSLIRLGQSGLVQPLDRKNVALEVDPLRGEVTITVNVSEIGKQGIWFTGGSGGLGGGYLGLVYNAINLLGLGELIGLDATVGPRSQNVVLDFVMRRFLDSRINLGLSLFRRYSSFDTLGANALNSALVKITRKDLGVRLSGNYPLTELSTLGVTLQAETVKSNDLTQGLLTETRFARRAVTVNWNRDSTDRLLNPHRGQTMVGSLSLSGGVLGGDVHALKPYFELKRFEPDPLSGGRNTLAFRTVLAHASGLSGWRLPVFERFFSDGTQVRGFAPGEMSPLSAYEIPVASGDNPGQPGTLSGVTAIGGDSLVTVQSDYRVPMSDRLSLIPFFDAGLTSALRRDASVNLISGTNALVRTSTGVEWRFQLPIINRPLSLILAYNPTRLDKQVLLDSGRWVRLREKAWRVRPGLSGEF
jgi:outer membrane protein insertion porin family